MRARGLASISMLLILLTSFSSAQYIGAAITSNAFPFGGPTGNPYCAEFVSSSVQTLADGNRIEQSTTRKTCRDSQGRTRNEISPPPFGDGIVPLPMVSIFDPIAHQNISFRLETKIAQVHKMPEVAMPPSGIATDHFVVRAEPGVAFTSMAPAIARGPAIQSFRTGRRTPPQREPLGQREINGVLAQGQRTTEVIPAGAVGNSQPITIVRETWMSDELHEVVLSKNNDPRTGEQTTEMKNLTRGEPDPSLFQVPADYTVQGP